MWVRERVLGFRQTLAEYTDSVHWFCPACGDEDPSIYNDPDEPDEDCSIGEKHKRIKESVTRIKLVFENCFILGAIDDDFAEAAEWRTSFAAGLDRQLSRCYECVRAYHAGRPNYIAALESEFGSEFAAEYSRIFDELDFARIEKGLSVAKKILENTLSVDRKQKALRGAPHALLAISEAMCCENYYTSDQRLSLHFDEVFSMIQTNKPLKLAEILPASTYFIFSEDPIRRDFAMSSWELIPEISPQTFEWAVRKGLVASIESISSVSPSNVQRIKRFWGGLFPILNKLDNKLMQEAIRNLDICGKPIPKLLVEHFICDSDEVFILLLKSFRVIVDVAPTHFHDAFKAAQYTVVIEQILKSPSFPTSFSQCENLEVDGVTFWALPFIQSVPQQHKYSACASLLQHLFEQLQNDPSLDQDAKATCLRAGLVVLKETLQSVLAKTEDFKTSTDRVLTNNTLAMVVRFKEAIFMCAVLSDPGQIELARLGMSVVQEALKLDCKVIRVESQMISNNENLHVDVNTFSISLWKSVLDAFTTDSMEMAKNILIGLQSFIGIEPFKEKAQKIPLTNDMRAFNKVFKELSDIVAKLFERMSDFQKKDLQPLFHSRVTAFPMYGALISADDEISQAMRMVLESYTGESTRKEALSVLLHERFFDTLSSIQLAIRKVGGSKEQSFGPMPRLLKISREVLDGLCDTNGGVLRDSVLAPKDLAIVKSFWVTQWALMNTIFNTLESWSLLPSTDKAQMSEFARDAMDHADALFDQFAPLKSSLAGLKDSTQDLLSAMRETLDYMVKWLRLKDVYLAKMLVGIISKLLKRLGDEDVVLPTKCIALNFIRDVAFLPKDEAIRTNLTDQQKAELMRAIDNNQGVQFLGSVDKSVDKPRAKVQGKLDAWSKAGDNNVTQTSTTKPKTNLTPGLSSHKDRLDKLRAAHDSKSRKAAPAPAATKDPSFVTNRIRAKEEYERKKKAAAANVKGVPGEGSGLQGIGVHGKDHTPKVDSIMVDSESSSSESDDEDDAAVKALYKNKSSSNFSAIEAARKKQQAQGPVIKTKVVRSAKDMRARLSPNMDLLHLTILNWNFFHQGETPPDSQDCQMISNKFMAPHEYKNTMYPLLVSEAWKDLVTVREESKMNKSKPFDIKIVNRMSVDNYIEISTTIFWQEMKDQDISDGSIVLLSMGQDPIRDEFEPNCLARVFKTARNQHNKEKMDVSYRVSNRVQSKLLSALAPNAEIRGVQITAMTTIEREFAALHSLEYYDLCDEILNAKPSPLLNYNDAAITPIERNYKVNKAQAKAILSAKENDAFTLIQGPPGSGKTKTIVAMVGALLTNTLAPQGLSIAQPTPISGNSSDSKPVPKKLLICAPSNAAVDEIVSRLKAGVKTLKGEFRKINVLRVGRLATVNPNVHDVSLEKQINSKLDGSNEENQAMMKQRAEREELHRRAGELKLTVMTLRSELEDARTSGNKTTEDEVRRQLDIHKREQATIGTQIEKSKDSGNIGGRNKDIKRREIQQQLIDAAHVVCATLSGSGHDMFKNLSVEFETVIIDEAAQCIELSALIPLKYGCSKCILVGDPKQLPPTVLSKMAANYGYEQSLFVRMQKNHPKDIHLLDTQYRMHPEISQFPSQQFYDGKLIDGSGMAALRIQPWHSNPLLGPYRFFDVKGSQQRGQGHSLMNIAEIKVAMQLYKRVTSDYKGVDWSGKVGIITPYKAQLQQLRLEFQRSYGDAIFDRIEFNTTDAFQGREAEVIIFSCVRAQASGGVGFLNDIRRMNVGLTRAKASLWVLGDSQSLMQGPYWQKLITDAQERGRYTDGDFMSLLNKPSVDSRAATAPFNRGGASNSTAPAIARSSIENDVPQPSIVDAMRRSSIQDIDMTDAPLFSGSEGNRPGSSGSASSSRTALSTGQQGNLLHEPQSRPFGQTCSLCGSYAHITMNCDHEQASNHKLNCYRCGELGHYSLNCPKERCLNCGDIGHISKYCVKQSLGFADKRKLEQGEAKWQRERAERTEKRKLLNAGSHNPQVPVIRSTSPPPLPSSTLPHRSLTPVSRPTPPPSAPISGRAPSLNSNNKRQRGSSPSDDMANKKIPTGPKTDRKDSSYGIGEVRRNGFPPGSINSLHSSGFSPANTNSGEILPFGGMGPSGFAQQSMARDDGGVSPASNASRESGSNGRDKGPSKQEPRRAPPPPGAIVAPRRKKPVDPFLKKPKPRR